MGREPTHEISIRVSVCGPDEFSEIWQTFGMVSQGLALKYPSTAVSSYALEKMEGEEGIMFDNETLAKVGAALRESGLGEMEITEAINSMQNFGILFRERAT